MLRLYYDTNVSPIHRVILSTEDKDHKAVLDLKKNQIL